MDILETLAPYVSLKPVMVKLLNLSYNKAVFGKPFCEYINLMNDLVYLIVYMELIKDEIAVNYSVCEEWQDILEDYKLQCIIDRFNCKGVNVKPLIFSIIRPDGIDNMAITLSANDCDSLFIVS